MGKLHDRMKGDLLLKAFISLPHNIRPPHASSIPQFPKTSTSPSPIY